VLVDGENVRRSRWPNVAPDELVARTAGWAAGDGAHAVVVFDGGAPGEHAFDERCTVVQTGAETADDWIERRAGELHEAGRRFLLVTSDRALRASAGRHAERTIGGGSFLGELLA
jgi:predicted RNA-binding protein with PIN domain